MRVFQDQTGGEWRVDVVERPGINYKGRFHLVIHPVGGDEGAPVELQDIRWNSRRTALRTLETMSLVELRRRLRSARGRARAH